VCLFFFRRAAKPLNWQFCQFAQLASDEKTDWNSLAEERGQEPLRASEQILLCEPLERRDLVKLFKVLSLVCALSIPAAFGQTAEVKAKPITDADIQLLRSNLQADKNQIVSQTMHFTDAESSAFWPVYRDYARDQQLIGDERVQLIKDYAQQYDKIDDARAKNLTQRLLNIDAKFLNLRQDYWPKFEKAIGAKRAAKFFQVDNRLTLLVNVQLTSEIPLVQ
jgi:hypothetical protein